MRSFRRPPWAMRPCRLCLAGSPASCLGPRHGDRRSRITGAVLLPARWSSSSRRENTGDGVSAPGRPADGTVVPPSGRRAVRWPNSLVTLAIETSCDDTCVAILEKEKEPGPEVERGRTRRARLWFEERITADNRAFGGIHPLTATESHMAALAPLVQRALEHLPKAPETGGGAETDAETDVKPDFVSVTRGPGMPSALAIGLAVAKGLAAAWRVPLVGVHHMQAHALTPRLVAAVAITEAAEAANASEPPATAAARSMPPPAAFPYLSLLVSGGHTILVHSRSLDDHRVLAAAANIAVGDLLDKCARAILPPGHIAAAEARANRSLPFGALLESFAFAEGKRDGGGAERGAPYGDYRYPAERRNEMAPFAAPAYGWQLEAPLGKGALRKALRFDFSGLNGLVLTLAGDGGDGSKATAMDNDERRVLARGTMQIAFEHLASRLLMALDAMAADAEETAAPTCLVVAGGVASNAFLRHVLRSALDVHGYGHLPVVAPPVSLCTDNAAMIAWAGMEMFEAGWQTELSVLPIKKWSMDASAADGGILGPEGWVWRKRGHEHR